MDDLDIYDDLDEFQEEENKKSKELLTLEEKCNDLLKTIESLQTENAVLKKNLKTIEVNFQNLLDTAKSEIKRKDKQINELRKEIDDICFRRKQPTFRGAVNSRNSYNEQYLNAASGNSHTATTTNSTIDSPPSKLHPTEQSQSSSHKFVEKPEHHNEEERRRKNEAVHEPECVSKSYYKLGTEHSKRFREDRNSSTSVTRSQMQRQESRDRRESRDRSIHYKREERDDRSKRKHSPADNKNLHNRHSKHHKKDEERLSREYHRSSDGHSIRKSGERHRGKSNDKSRSFDKSERNRKHSTEYWQVVHKDKDSNESETKNDITPKNCNYNKMSTVQICDSGGENHISEPLQTSVEKLETNCINDLENSSQSTVANTEENSNLKNAFDALDTPKKAQLYDKVFGNMQCSADIVGNTLFTNSITGVLKSTCAVKNLPLNLNINTATETDKIGFVSNDAVQEPLQNQEIGNRNHTYMDGTARLEDSLHFEERNIKSEMNSNIDELIPLKENKETEVIRTVKGEKTVEDFIQDDIVIEEGAAKQQNGQLIDMSGSKETVKVANTTTNMTEILAENKECVEISQNAAIESTAAVAVAVEADVAVKNVTHKEIDNKQNLQQQQENIKINKSECNRDVLTDEAKSMQDMNKKSEEVVLEMSSLESNKGNNNAKRDTDRENCPDEQETVHNIKKENEKPKDTNLKKQNTHREHRKENILVENMKRSEIMWKYKIPKLCAKSNVKREIYANEDTKEDSELVTSTTGNEMSADGKANESMCAIGHVVLKPQQIKVENNTHELVKCTDNLTAVVQASKTNADVVEKHNISEKLEKSATNNSKQPKSVSSSEEHELTLKVQNRKRVKIVIDNGDEKSNITSKSDNETSKCIPAVAVKEVSEQRVSHQASMPLECLPFKRRRIQISFEDATNKTEQVSSITTQEFVTPQKASTAAANETQTVSTLQSSPDEEFQPQLLKRKRCKMRIEDSEDEHEIVSSSNTQSQNEPSVNVVKSVKEPALPLLNISNDEQFRDIDSRLQCMFESPCKEASVEEANITLSSSKLLSTPSAVAAITTENHEFDVSDTVNADVSAQSINESISNVTIDETNSNLEINSSSLNTKRISLGTSFYRFEKVSDNVVNLFITRKRRGKTKSTTI